MYIGPEMYTSTADLHLSHHLETKSTRYAYADSRCGSFWSFLATSYREISPPTRPVGTSMAPAWHLHISGKYRDVFTNLVLIPTGRFLVPLAPASSRDEHFT